MSNSEPGHYDKEGHWWEVDYLDPDWGDRPCTACKGTGVERGDIYNPDEPPCLECGGDGTV